MPGVLLRALSEYNFVGTPLWRMSDGKDLVWVELTFHKNLPTPRVYKKGAESRRQPAPATRPPPRREPTQIERETLPPPPQTTIQTPHQITLQEYSYHHRIADYHQTSTSTSVSRDTASEESQERVSNTTARSRTVRTTTRKCTQSTRSTTYRTL